MHNPTPENANQVIQLLGYLKGTQQHRLTYYRDNHPMKPQLTKYAEKDRDFIDLLYTNEHEEIKGNQAYGHTDADY